MENEQITPEQIAKHYSAMLDSVAVITAARANPEAYADDETIVSRNVEHLRVMLAKDFWTDEDMTPINDAIAANE
jgi:hypothetical protein